MLENKFKKNDYLYDYYYFKLVQIVILIRQQIAPITILFI